MDYDDYQLIKNECKKKIDDLEISLQNHKLSNKNSDIKLKLDRVIKIVPNLYKLYVQGNDETKNTILCSILAEKLEFHENSFRTPKLNSALSHILLISNKLKDKKKGKSTFENAFSRKVTAEGFEPSLSEPKSEVLSIKLCSRIH